MLAKSKETASALESIFIITLVSSGGGLMAYSSAPSSKR